MDSNNIKQTNRKVNSKIRSRKIDSSDISSSLSANVGSIAKRTKIDFGRVDLPRFANRNTFVRFLVITTECGDFSKMSPFVIMKEIQKLVGPVKNVRKIKDGLLIEVEEEKQSRKLLGISNFGDWVVKVVPHRTLNYCKGVITCRDLINCTTDEILENLKEEGVTDVKRITVKRNGEMVNTASLILTFDCPSLPDSIRAAMYKLPVRRYVPAPNRCFRCQKFGHFASFCKDEQICVCGRPPHEGQPCTSPFACINCFGNHISSSRSCPIYQKEFEIQKFRLENNVSYAEARRSLHPRFIFPQKSFADAAKTQESSSNIDSLAACLIPKLIKAFDAHVDQAMKNIRTTFENQNKASMTSLIPETQTHINTIPKPIPKVLVSRKKSTDTLANYPTRETEQTYPSLSIDESTSVSNDHSIVNRPNVHPAKITAQSKTQCEIIKPSPDRSTLQAGESKKLESSDGMFISANSSSSDEELLSTSRDKRRSSYLSKDWKKEYMKNKQNLLGTKHEPPDL